MVVAAFAAPDALAATTTVSAILLRLFMMCLIAAALGCEALEQLLTCCSPNWEAQEGTISGRVILAR
jgi:hypothetical protein